LFDFGGVMVSKKSGSAIFVIEEQYDLNQWYIMGKILDVVISFSKWTISILDFHELLISKLWKTIWEELFKVWWDRSDVCLLKNMDIFVEKLKSLWYKCYLLSDTNEIHESANKMKYLYDMFDLKILSCEIWFSKISDVTYWTTDFFDYWLKSLDIKPEESIFIDDLQANCDVANMAGIKTILAKNPEQIIQDLSSILSID
jgi:putative hydrolase of the HAD superfamily